jgi:two-component system, NarL family, invasion response regulator UvrY
MDKKDLSSIRLLIVDDHVIIRRGLKFILDSNFGIQEIHETDSCLDLKRLLKQTRFTHIILDMQLNDGNVMEILSDILREHSDVSILIYTMSPEEIFGARLINMGISGFLNKQVPESEVVNALNTFFSGQQYMSNDLRELLGNRKSSDKSSGIYKDLSERELMVVQYLLKGLGIKEISHKLNIKSSTVATFKARIFNKLGVSNVIELKNIAELYSFRNTGS